VRALCRKCGAELDVRRGEVPQWRCDCGGELTLAEPSRAGELVAALLERQRSAPRLIIASKRRE